MRKYWSILWKFSLVILMVIQSPLGVLAASKQTEAEKLERFIQQNQEQMAGLGVAVLDAKGPVYEKYAGYADKAAGLKVNEKTVFDWGSVTKLTVWVSVMQLVEAGKLDLKQDIRTYLPEGFLKNLQYDQPITILNLMNHNAGFEESLASMMVANEEDLLNLEEYLTTIQPTQVYEPGKVVAYSNWGVGLAAYIVEQISEQSYADYAQSHIFKPLRMNHTAVAADLSDNPTVKMARQQLKGYSAEGELLERNIDYITVFPAGSCVSTLGDFENFASPFQT